MPILEIADAAHRDLYEIWLYIAENDFSAADNFLDALYEKFNILASMPGLGRPRNELIVNLRSFAFKRYVILYFQVDKGIEIFRVLHGSRDIEHEFEDSLPDDKVN